MILSRSSSDKAFFGLRVVCVEAEESVGFSVLVGDFDWLDCLSSAFKGLCCLRLDFKLVAALILAFRFGAIGPWTGRDLLDFTKYST